MKTSQIIEIANKRTERRAEKNLDLKAELLGVIQRFCDEHRFYWRRKSAIINTLADGTFQYELTDPTGANLKDFQQVSQFKPHVFDSSGNVKGTLEAEFDIEQQEILSENQSTGQPTVYWITGISTFNCYPRPNAVFRIRIPYWAVPTINPEELDDDVVPLVPVHLHHILQKGLEAEIFRYTLGEGATKYQATKAEYDALVKKAAMKEDFAPGAFNEWRNQDCGDAVQSS